MLNKTFLLLLLFSLSISAQNTAELIGTVTDKVTHQPLIGADVYIKELNKGVSTDARDWHICPKGIIPCGLVSSVIKPLERKSV